MAQPNFNRIKRVVYNIAINSQSFEQIPLFETVINKSKGRTYHDKLRDARKELNVALDNWDIRSVGALIDVIPKKGSGIPGWIRNKDFSIDYNQSGELDLIKRD